MIKKIYEEDNDVTKKLHQKKELEQTMNEAINERPDKVDKKRMESYGL